MRYLRAAVLALAVIALVLLPAALVVGGCTTLQERGDEIGRTLQDHVAPAIRTVAPPPFGELAAGLAWAVGGIFTAIGAKKVNDSRRRGKALKAVLAGAEGAPTAAKKRMRDRARAAGVNDVIERELGEAT